MNNGNAAPTVALTIDPTNPPAEIAKRPDTKTRNIAPITPITLLPNRPSALPVVRVPVDPPASAPTAGNIVEPAKSTISPIW